MLWGVEIRHCRYPPPLELTDDICNSGSQMKDRKYFHPRNRWCWKSVRNLSDGRRTRHTSCTNATLVQDLKFEIPKPRCGWKAGVFFVIISYIRGEAGYLFPLFFLCFRYHDCCLRRTRSSVFFPPCFTSYVWFSTLVIKTLFRTCLQSVPFTSPVPRPWKWMDVVNGYNYTNLYLCEGCHGCPFVSIRESALKFQIPLRKLLIIQVLKCRSANRRKVHLLFSPSYQFPAFLCAVVQYLYP